MTPEQTEAWVAETEARVKSKIIPKYEPVFPSTWPSIEMRIRDEINEIAGDRWNYRLSLDVTGHVHFNITTISQSE